MCYRMIGFYPSASRLANLVWCYQPSKGLRSWQVESAVCGWWQQLRRSKEGAKVSKTLTDGREQRWPGMPPWELLDLGSVPWPCIFVDVTIMASPLGPKGRAWDCRRNPCGHALLREPPKEARGVWGLWTKAGPTIVSALRFAQCLKCKLIWLNPNNKVITRSSIFGLCSLLASD